MPHQSICLRAQLFAGFVAYAVLLAAVMPAAAQPDQGGSPSPFDTKPAAGQRQAELDSVFAQTLSGATLDGSYTSTGPGSDPNKLSHDKYTLGEVRKVGPNMWLIPARIEYGEHDVTLPVTVPVHWAGDTPVIVVNNLGLPPFGTVSARVMFFGGHYAGYWKHGQHGGHLFGVIQPREKDPAARPAAENEPPSSADPSAGEHINQ
jgi:hypothetical protein